MILKLKKLELYKISLPTDSRKKTAQENFLVVKKYQNNYHRKLKSN